IYIAGESYAGTYIPYIAKAILDRNNNTTDNKLKYNLRGVAIGNGWIDPIAQYNAYYTFSVKHNLLTGNSKELAKQQLDTCMDALKEKLTIHQDLCELILETVLENSRQTNGSTTTCINQYDIRDHSDSYPSCGIAWPYELTSIAKYLRRTDVVSAIHANSQQIGWVECSSGVGRGFTGDTSPPAVN
ncbi:27057_t:CDS:2, partial [Dentiscutata erythropus]